MSLESAITENTAAIRELIVALGNGVATAPAAAPAPTEEKKGRGRPPKEKTEAVAETKSAVEPTDDDPFADEAPATEPEKPKAVTIEDVRKALIDLSKTDKAKATAILKGCKNKDGNDCASIGEISPADYARVVKEATA